MTTRAWIVAALLAGCGSKQTMAPAAQNVSSQTATTTANHPPEEPTWEMPPGMRLYYVVLLQRGPTWTDEATPDAVAIGQGHMQYIRDTAEAGKLLVAGPFAGQTDPDDYAGIYVYDVGSLAEAQSLVGGDPAVRAERFTPVFLIWLANEGLRVNPDVAATVAGPTESTAVGPGAEPSDDANRLVDSHP